MATAFPKGFFWGAATSAHQVEGNTHNDWTEWEKHGHIQHQERSGLASDHYRRYREDFSLAKKLGHNAHRLSLEWSRIEPEPGRFDPVAIAHYHDVIDELRKHGLEPIITIHHFTNPVWFAAQRGWERKENVELFARFVQRVAQEYATKVRYWITINEPTVVTTLGYLDARWPPQRKSYRLAWIAIRNLVHAHRQAYAILHQQRADCLVGVANNIVDYQPSRRWHLGDMVMKSLAMYWYNTWWLRKTVATQDFLGLNFYFHHALRFRFIWPAKLFLPEAHPTRPRSDLGWELNPAAFGRAIRWLSTFGKPILVTEHGLADAMDRHRPAYIQESLRELRAAITSGVDVRGYLHWSLLDNFEWADGFAPRFGLVAVDYQTQQRTPRPSAEIFRHICQTNGTVLDDHLSTT